MALRSRTIATKLLLVGAISMVGAATPASAYDGELYRVCKLDPNGDNFLALRSCESSKCKMLAKLRSGTYLWTFEPYSSKGWRHVGVMRDIDDQYSPDGPSGYVFDKYICYIDLRR